MEIYKRNEEIERNLPEKLKRDFEEIEEYIRNKNYKEYVIRRSHYNSDIDMFLDNLNVENKAEDD